MKHLWSSSCQAARGTWALVLKQLLRLLSAVLEGETEAEIHLWNQGQDSRRGLACKQCMKRGHMADLIQKCLSLAMPLGHFMQPSLFWAGTSDPLHAKKELLSWGMYSSLNNRGNDHFCKKAFPASLSLSLITKMDIGERGNRVSFIKMSTAFPKWSADPQNLSPRLLI